VPAGTTNVILWLDALDDSIDEIDETVEITLTNAQNAAVGAPAVHTYTLQDDEFAVAQFQAADTWINEDEGQTSVWVTLSLEVSRTASVDFVAVDATASNGLDYTLAEGTLTFEPGTTALPIDLTALDDALDEEDYETFDVVLLNAMTVALGSPTNHAVVIVDEDLPPAVEFAQLYSSGDESADANLEVVLQAPSEKTVTVDYGWWGGDAIGGGVDFTLEGGTLTFDPGQTSRWANVAVTDDALDENDEVVIVFLGSPWNASLGANTQHTYTILDNDARRASRWG